MSYDFIIIGWAALTIAMVVVYGLFVDHYAVILASNVKSWFVLWQKKATKIF